MILLFLAHHNRDHHSYLMHKTVRQAFLGRAADSPSDDPILQPTVMTNLNFQSTPN